MALLTIGNVPLATLVAALNEIPGGRPERRYLYGGAPPVAAGKGVFTLPPDGRLLKFGMSGADSGDGGRGGGEAEVSATWEDQAPSPSALTARTR